MEGGGWAIELPFHLRYLARRGDENLRIEEAPPKVLYGRFPVPRGPDYKEYLRDLWNCGFSETERPAEQAFRQHYGGCSIVTRGKLSFRGFIPTGSSGRLGAADIDLASRTTSQLGGG